VTRVGFEVRVEVTVDESPEHAVAATTAPVLVTLTRAEFRVLDVDTDAVVWVHPVRGAPTVRTSAAVTG
jgi:sulfate transport system ATP-binding protein